jgi:hypothetical protein
MRHPGALLTLQLHMLARQCSLNTCCARVYGDLRPSALPTSYSWVASGGVVVGPLAPHSGPVSITAEHGTYLGTEVDDALEISQQTEV